MCALKLQLQRDEEVVFESERAVLTNLRLLVNLDKRNRDTITDDVPLGNVTDFKRDSRGEESQMGVGVKTFGAGVLIALAQVILPDLPAVLGVILFLASAVSVVVGFYLILNRGLLRVKPSTSVLFTVMGSRDVPVYFRGRDNPEAEELTRRYVRAKRDLTLS